MPKATLSLAVALSRWKERARWWRTSWMDTPTLLLPHRVQAPLVKSQARYMATLVPGSLCWADSAWTSCHSALLCLDTLYLQHYQHGVTNAWEVWTTLCSLEEESSSFNKNRFRKNTFLITYTEVIKTDMLISQKCWGWLQQLMNECNNVTWNVTDM